VASRQPRLGSRLTGASTVRLAVLGAPISHSRSPDLHHAAYGSLGLDWAYDAVEVHESDLADFVSTRGGDWRGLSLTMPLKRAVMPMLDEVSELVSSTGTANTVLFARDQSTPSTPRLRGFNTDVFGIVQSFSSRGFMSLPLVHILGGGATAASAIAAVAELGTRRVVVWVRNPGKAHGLGEVGRAVGVDVELAPLAGAVFADHVPNAIISTLPQGVDAELAFSEEVRGTSVLFDVAYDPWPSPLASSWFDLGGEVIPGIDMLINQALMQVRIFVSGDPNLELPNETAVLLAMRAAAGL
jgi:shikimate dehydrogenase